MGMNSKIWVRNLKFGYEKDPHKIGWRKPYKGGRERRHGSGATMRRLRERPHGGGREHHAEVERVFFFGSMAI